MDDHGGQLDFDFTADDVFELPRDPGEKGWFLFLSEQQQALAELNRKFGVILNRRVRIRLVGFDRELEGKLVMNSLQLPTSAGEAISLRIGKVAFFSSDIESCNRID